MAHAAPTALLIGDLAALSGVAAANTGFASCVSWDATYVYSGSGWPAWCGWTGVGCDPVTARVVAVDAQGSCTVATLPSCVYSAGNCLSCTSLCAATSMLTTLPASFTSLGALVNLNLAYQYNLRGTVPVLLSALTNLQELNLATTSFTGSLPAWIGSLSNLQFLSFAGSTSLLGPIPAAIGGLNALQYLNLAGLTRLTGTVPVTISQLSQLTFLSLQQLVSVAGTLPAQMFSLSALRHLDVGRSSFSGTVPPAIGGLSALTYLCLASTSGGCSGPKCLKGSLPSTLGALSGLQVPSTV